MYRLSPVKMISLQYMATMIPVNPTPEPSSSTTLSPVKTSLFSMTKSPRNNALRHTCIPTMFNDVRLVCSITRTKTLCLIKPTVDHHAENTNIILFAVYVHIHTYGDTLGEWTSAHYQIAIFVYGALFQARLRLAFKFKRSPNIYKHVFINVQR